MFTQAVAARLRVRVINVDLADSARLVGNQRRG
jgi:hypothetical protein